MLTLLTAAALALQVAPTAAPSDESSPDNALWGHSRHGAKFDVGPRQRPWLMDGIGSVHLPITSTHPEVQQWFDQGLAHLHGFWFFEAERAFRWCLKLDPECAMAYWGLARLGVGGLGDDRAPDFATEAMKRVAGVTPIERGFIEVEGALAKLAKAEKDDDERAVAKAKEAVRVRLERLLMDEPQNVEVKALHWLTVGRLLSADEEGDRYGREAVLAEILELDPNHIGALHYRVHNWDGKEGKYAIDSCRGLTALAPNSGHLQHMPGHVLSGIGMWHEAAIAMDRATRVEKLYMEQHSVLPENNWDYVHNLDYLCYIQSRLGMHEAALLGAKQLLVAPPPTNLPVEMVEFGDMMALGTMLRTLLMAERWQDVLDGELLPWSEELPPPIAMLRAYAEARAQVGLGDLEAAEAKVLELEKSLAEMSAGEGATREGAPDEALLGADAPIVELKGRIALARGDVLEGIRMLTEAAEGQVELWQDDPPQEASLTYDALGEALLELGSAKLAAAAFERSLETVFHDGIALAGLVRCYDMLGEDELAAAAMAALEVVWSEADPGNARLAAARATGVVAAPAGTVLPERFAQAMEQRPYRATVLDVVGPSLYRPAPAPQLSALDAQGATVTLADMAGSNVLVIFYLGEECPHCVEQLKLAQEHAKQFAEAGTRVLAVSKDSVEEIAAQQAGFDLVLLSDADFENARRFASYDEFEEIELHSTFLVDATGHVHWARIGGEPFTNFEFLLAEAKKLGADGLVTELRVAGR
jgi:peroxiredoxin